MVSDIKVELNRTDPRNPAFIRDFRKGNNPLFNVLIAYVHFDPEVKYCQGMNFVVGRLLKYTQQVNKKGQLEYNEEDAFFLMLHICVRKLWREIYHPNMVRIREIKTLLAEILETTYPEVHEHLMSISGFEMDDLIPLLIQSQILSLFTRDL
jgi:hypothetical protein